MVKLLTRVLFASLIMGLPFRASDVKACTCMPQQSTYKEFQEARAVFVGKVIRSRDVAMTEVIRDKTFQVLERVFVFKVSESFKGLKESQVEINVGRIDSSCFQGFGVGQSYLVYAFGKSANSLGSGACSRTTNLSDAADDLHYIRELLRGVPEARIYGSVMRVETTLVEGVADRRVTPIAGLKVSIEGKGTHFEAVTDKNGLFRLKKIPDGRYTVRPMLPKHYMPYLFAEEEILLGSKEQLVFYTRFEPGAAVNVSFRLAWNNHLSGRVVDSEGNAIVRYKASLFLDHRPSPLPISRDQYDHHAGGVFNLTGLAPGRYLLSVDIRAPFVDHKRRTRFYYPNTDALEQATKIEIGEAKRYRTGKSGSHRIMSCVGLKVYWFGQTGYRYQV